MDTHTWLSCIPCEWTRNKQRQPTTNDFNVRTINVLMFSYYHKYGTKHFCVQNNFLPGISPTPPPAHEAFGFKK